MRMREYSPRMRKFPKLQHAGAKAAGVEKTITVTVPAETVKRLEAYAQACDVPIEAVWERIAIEAQESVTDLDGLWSNPNSYVYSVVHIAPRLSRRKACDAARA